MILVIRVLVAIPLLAVAVGLKFLYDIALISTIDFTRPRDSKLGWKGIFVLLVILATLNFGTGAVIVAIYDRSWQTVGWYLLGIFAWSSFPIIFRLLFEAFAEEVASRVVAKSHSSEPL